MKTLSIIATSVLVSAMTMSSAHAQGMAGGNEFEWEMNMTDANNDGSINKEEFMKMQAKLASKRFAMMDVNEDGKVSADEFIFAMTNR